MIKPKLKLKITGEHISDDGKNKCIHYSDGVVVIEPIDEEARIQVLENEGLTRSDAQGVVMAEDNK